MAVLCIGLLLGWAVACSAVAQDRSIGVPQLYPPGSAAQAVTTADVPTPGALSSVRGQAGKVTPPGQVGETRRTAEAPPDVSTPRQGRMVAVSPVGGQDRCDRPGAAGTAPPECRDRIETRAGEYSKPTAAPVTAEGRLLLLTQPQPAMTADTAARRLGVAGAPIDELAGSAAGELAAAIQQNANTAVPQAAQTPAGVPAATVLSPGATASPR